MSGHQSRGLDRYHTNRISWNGTDAFYHAIGERFPTKVEWEKVPRRKYQRAFPRSNLPSHNGLATFRGKFSDLNFKVMESVDGLREGCSR